MKINLKRINIDLQEKDIHMLSTKLLIINSSDGTPRWIINANARKPLFLKFYLTSSLRSRFYVAIIKLVFLLGLQRMLFTTRDASYKNTSRDSIIELSDTNWAIFTGTVGPNNKIIVYNEIKGKSYFYKIANSHQSNSLIDNEEMITQLLFSLDLVHTNYSEIKRVNKNTIRLEDLSKEGKRSSRFNETHLSALSELYKKTSLTLPLSSLPIMKDIEIKLNELEFSLDNRIPVGLLRKLRTLANSLENIIVDAGFCHGDFTPWNIYISNNCLSVYDWELAKQLIPIGFDAYHFIIQQGILVDRKPWESIKKEIEQVITPEVLSGWSQNTKRDDYLSIYLLINTVSNLHLYSKQANWHVQVHWLLNTWIEALSDEMQKIQSPRELLIMDVFDFLHDKSYGSLKFPDTAPELLSEYSDIDLCIQKSDFRTINNFINTHPLTNNIHLEKKSFMASIFIYLVDGSMLNIDLIWKIKRKSMLMLDAESMLTDTYRNMYGVRQISAKDQVRYIGLFYGLNDTEIPTKYHADFELLSKEDGILDTLIYNNFKKNITGKPALVQFLKTKKENKFLHRIIHQINYYIDSIKPFLFSKGLTITFSGVDGAGKSTVIDNLKYEIEKKVRKQVVVLRHRPSILPILSAWVVGKANAEQESASTLPRQGNNTSLLSSIFRFSYYYLDYLIGQLYVYVKYISRGWVVLYDRYYFDFINDSKRSNIRLPGFISKAGYKLLLKPDLNFFLFADTDVILSRKQELDRSTITQLTHEYKSLFGKLNKSSSAEYIIVKNNTLKTTIDLVMHKSFKEGA